MAKNWKVGEAVKAIKAGNKEDILDIGRRFPLFANLAAQVNEAGIALLECVPEYCSARKIESVLKDGVQESSEDEGAEEEAVEEKEEPKAKPAKKATEKKAAPKKAAKVEEEEDDSLESKSAKELFEMCKEAGLKVKPKQDKSVYIEALNAANETAEEEDDWDESEEEEEPKKPAKKAAAKPAKKAAAKKEADDEDDDWEV